MTTLGGRRFLLTLGCGIVATGLVIAGTIDPTTYRDIILGTVAAYIVGNTWQKHSEATRTESLKGDA